MSTVTYAYPFDPTGTLASNKITSERQILSAPNHSRFFFIIPLAGPFFRTGHKLIHHPSGRILVEGVDYALTHRFHDASLACGKPIYGSITFFDKLLTGLVELEYQSVGGPWTLTQAAITEILSNSLSNPRITTWEQISNPPHEFPVVDHPWELTDLVGASDVVEKLGLIEDAIRDAATGTNDAHINDFTNPHQVTKAQVGLSQLLNYPIASTAESTGGTAHDRYMTPLRTREAILSMVGTAYAAHAASVANPHQVTKAQVGLPLVANYGVATTDQAIEGTATDLYMTPITTAAVLNDLTNQIIVPHINSLNNPHQVSKAQVGLSQVENLAISDTPTAVAATSNLVYMTPLRTRELVDALFGDTLVNHINDRSNPHGVSKSQLGLGDIVNLPIASTAAAQAGADDSGYMTPRLTYEAILALGGGGGGSSSGIDSVHRGNLENPHQVTAAQVGALTSSETQALLAEKLGRLATAANSERLEGQTAAEIVRRAKARFDWSAAAPREIDDGLGGTITVNDGVTWTALGTFVPPGVADPDNPVSDMVFYFTGGDRRTANTTPIYLVKLNIFNDPRLEVEQLAGVVNETQFGYVRDLSTQVITVYVRSAPSRNAMSVLVMSDPTGGLGLTQEPLDAEPFNIKYADSFLYMGGSPNIDAYPGDTLFGKNPHHNDLPDFDASVDFFNVAESEDDVLTARQTFANMRNDMHDFIAASAYADVGRHAVLDDLLGWTWNFAASAVEHAPATSSLTMLLSPHPFTSYAFEVEVGSTDESDMAIGVCAAFIRKNGKDYGIYALRTPGGLVTASAAGNLPGGDIYKNFSVGYNLLQEDAIDLGSTSTDITGAASWAVAGTCRMRVTRSGSVIFVQSSQLGSTDVTTGPTITIDLNELPELAVFQAPTMWGLVKYAQPATSFRVIARPDSHPPYVVRAQDATTGNDVSTVNRFNGMVWLSEPLTLASKFAKPGRLIYSDMSHRFYFARRDGTLRELGIEAYTSENVTVLTT